MIDVLGPKDGAMVPVLSCPVPRVQDGMQDGMLLHQLLLVPPPPAPQVPKCSSTPGICVHMMWAHPNQSTRSYVSGRCIPYPSLGFLFLSYPLPVHSIFLSPPQQKERGASTADEGDAGQASGIEDSRDDRPIGGRRPAAQPGSDGNGGASGDLDESSSRPGEAVEPASASEDGLKPWQRRRKPAAAAAAAAKKTAVAAGPSGGGDDDSAQPAAEAPPVKPWQKNRKKSGPAAEEGAGTAKGPAKPWQKKKATAAAVPKADPDVLIVAAAGAAESEAGDEDANSADVFAGAGGGASGDADGGGAAAAAPVKPWLRKKKPGGVGAAKSKGAGGVATGGSGDDADVVVVAEKPWKAAAAARVGAEAVGDAPSTGAPADGGGMGGGPGGGEASVADLEACLEDRDWKKRVACFEVRIV